MHAQPESAQDQETQPDAPAPAAPAPPQEGECCESGCEECVWTRYQAARRAYEADYAAWLERHGQHLFGD